MMKLLKTYLIIFLLCACSQVEENPTLEEGEEELSEQVTFNYTSDSPYNLNIIYFIPNDRQANPNYHERISQIMLDGQAFFKKYMKHWGYGERTFGLLKDEEKQRVKLHVINGSQPGTAYPYEGGAAEMRKDIDAYFQSNPSEVASDHYLIIGVHNHQASGGTNPANLPFYGIGRYAYALDYPGMSIESFGKPGFEGDEATKWIGGLLHEMGHGINLPHNKEKVSELADPNLGTALMGSGNFTYGKAPTFLTHSSAAYLNHSQLFATEQKNFYGPVNVNITSIQASFENGHINVSGTFETDIPVTDISISNRPISDPGGYQAVKWVVKPNGNSFTVNMPISEFWQKGNTAYELSIVRHHTNGSNSSTSYGYTFENDVPQINFGDRDELLKDNWEIIDFSSEETSGEGNTGRVADVIDNDPSTYWHSKWTGNGTNYPHHFTVDMQSVKSVQGLSITQRNGQRRIKQYKVLVSNDNSNWTLLTEGELPNTPGREYYELATTSSFRYFKFEAIDAHDGMQFAALAEIGFY